MKTKPLTVTQVAKLVEYFEEIESEAGVARERLQEMPVFKDGVLDPRREAENRVSDVLMMACNIRRILDEA